MYRKTVLLISSVFCLLVTGISSAQVSLTATVNTPTGSFTTLKGAFDAINAGTHRGVIAITITANTTETATASLNANGSGSAVYTSISIQPSGGDARIISGAIAAGSSLIRLNGADNVTIDGLNTDGNSLTIENTTVSATPGTATILLINGATANTITNVSVLGAFSGGVNTDGGTVYFSTDGLTTSGNDNNTISFSNIGPSGSNLPTKGIYMSGNINTTAAANSGNNINGNNIFDYFSPNQLATGVYLSTGTTNNNITNNKFYQTASRTQTSTSQHSAIWINNTSGNNFVVTGNTIGYASSTATGTYTITGAIFIAISIRVGTTTSSDVSGNTITNLAMYGTGSFSIISISAGLATCNNNVIGSQSTHDAITFTFNSSAASSNSAITVNFIQPSSVNNNTIGGITLSNSSTGAVNFYGIAAYSSLNSLICQNNTIGGTVENSISINTTSTSNVVAGIYNTHQSGIINGNIIRNMTTASGTGTGIDSGMSGITTNQSSGSVVPLGIGSNTIYNLKNTFAGAASISGIVCVNQGTNLVEKNLIYDLDASHTSAVINGIIVLGGTSTFRNNMIRLGVSGNSANIGFQINGIYETGGTNNIHFNSIYFGGNPTSGSANSFGFRSTVTITTRSYLNNIFFNARSNSGSTGRHYAINVGGTAANPSGLTSNFNILLTPGTGGNIGLFNNVNRTTLAAWRTATGKDVNSQNTDPFFVAPTASIPDLHILTSVVSPADGTGTPIVSVTDDYDENTRADLTPVDIGADAFVGLPTIVSFTPQVVYVSGGQTVTITGTNFVFVSAVKFNDMDAASYIVVNSTTITAVTPASLTSGNITVTTATGIATSPTTYTLTATASSLQSATGIAINTGDYLWSGNATTEWTNSSNWYRYNGTDFTDAISLPALTSKVFILASATSGICISNANNAVVSAPGSAASNLYLGTGATLTINAGQNLDVYGDWTNNGIFTPNVTGTISFVGTSNQAIGGTSANNFTNLVLNKTSGGVTLGKPVAVTGTLTMTNGIIYTSATNLLTVGTTPAAPGTILWTAGTVVGPLKRFYGATSDASQEAGIFPVGNVTYNRYARVNFTANPGGGSITAEYKAGAAPIGYNGLVAIINGQFINNYENEGYWEITPNGGNLNTTNYTLILRGNRLSTVNNLSKLRIIKSSNHIAWNDNPTGDGDHVPASASLTDFTIGATTMTGFSWFNVGSDNANPLPVELTQFSASCNGKNEVVVKWSTASEQNSQKFILEKSHEMNHWVAFKEIAAAGNSNFKIDYTTTDPAPSSGISYYRMVQVDNDGQKELYGPISISCDSQLNAITVSPNPAKSKFTVEITSTEMISNASIQITDLTGKIVSSRNMHILEGVNHVPFEDENLQLGTYIINVVTVNNQFNPVRIVLQ